MRGYTHRFGKARKKMLLIMLLAGLGYVVIIWFQGRRFADELVRVGSDHKKISTYLLLKMRGLYKLTANREYRHDHVG